MTKKKAGNQSATFAVEFMRTLDRLPANCYPGFRMNGGISHSEFSARGGKAKSEAKLVAAQANLAKAQKAKAAKAAALGRGIAWSKQRGDA
jgi:hypothetical protein